MSIKLTEEQVLDIHMNSRINGGRTKAHTLIKRHGLTVNEYYAIMALPLDEAVKKARKGHRFVSWESHYKSQDFKPTQEELRGSRATACYGGEHT